MLDVRFRGFKLENNMITKEQAYTIAEEYLKKSLLGTHLLVQLIKFSMRKNI